MRLGFHVLERAHVVHAIAELHEQHANVARHRDQHFAEIFRLTVFLRGEVDLRQLRYAIDEKCDFRAELTLDVLIRRECVFDDVMQKSSDDACCIETQADDDFSNGYRMRKIRIAAFSSLSLVRFFGVRVRPRYEINIRPWMIFLDPTDQFLRRQHTIPRQRGRIVSMLEANILQFTRQLCDHGDWRLLDVVPTLPVMQYTSR